uniref:ParB N-terminal domain-containing protein n=1 Tax=Streptomyces abikoensis TaxID=97398 RepID=UPI0035711542
MKENNKVKNAKIELSDIRLPGCAPREAGDTRPLERAIELRGLCQPIIMREDGVTLLSGHRRLTACRNLGMQFAAALVPSDVIEAATALQKESRESDPATTLSMSARERMNLAHQLHAMPTPSARVAHHVYAAEVAGIPARSYWRIRAVINRARYDDTQPPFSAVRARRLADLMLEAVDFPPEGWAPTRIIEYLHSLRAVGDIPESLDSIESPSRFSRTLASEDAPSEVRDQPAACDPPSRNPAPAAILAPLLRPAPEIARAVASLAGVCVGISAITEVSCSSAADLAHWSSEVRNCRRIINSFHALLKEAASA